MSTSPLLPCKDPPLLHRLTLRASSSQDEMDEDPRPLVHHGGGDWRRGAGPLVPPRIVGPDTGGLRRPCPTPPVPARTGGGGWTSSSVSSSSPRPMPPQLDRAMITLTGRNGPRHLNEYVDSPATMPRPNPSNSDSREMISLLGPERPTPMGGRSQGGTILTQPQPSGLKDHSSNTANTHKGHIGSLAPDPAPGGGRQMEDDGHDSIICKKCGKCKCNDCTSPRELPSRWVCEERYECSARKVVEYCSCLCCVKSVFYHCANSEDSMSTADVPCSCCEQAHCCKRWTCMGVMSLCLPCLCLYWPLRAVVGLTTACYNGCSRRGCQCNRDKSSGQTLTKTPLIDSESSSA